VLYIQSRRVDTIETKWGS